MLRDKMDPNKSNGGVFLGLNGVVIKSHGGADPEGYAAAIEMGYNMVRHELLSKIGETIHSHSRTAARTRRRRSGFVTMLRTVVLGCGSYLPARIVTNDELARSVDTSDEWIVQRTGIHQRHIAAEGELTSDLGIHAARAALASAGHVDPQTIDLIVLATSTPDNTFPAAAVTVQAGLGITRGAAFDCRRSARASSMRWRPPTACCEPAPTSARW
jgi:hypothetical protein